MPATHFQVAPFFSLGTKLVLWKFNSITNIAAYFLSIWLRCAVVTWGTLWNNRKIPDWGIKSLFSLNIHTRSNWSSEKSYLYFKIIILWLIIGCLMTFHFTALNLNFISKSISHLWHFNYKLDWELIFFIKHITKAT